MVHEKRYIQIVARIPRPRPDTVLPPTGLKQQARGRERFAQTQAICTYVSQARFSFVYECHALSIAGTNTGSDAAINRAFNLRRWRSHKVLRCALTETRHVTPHPDGAAGHSNALFVSRKRPAAAVSSSALALPPPHPRRVPPSWPPFQQSLWCHAPPPLSLRSPPLEGRHGAAGSTGDRMPPARSVARHGVLDLHGPPEFVLLLTHLDGPHALVQAVEGRADAVVADLDHL